MVLHLVNWVNSDHLLNFSEPKLLVCKTSKIILSLQNYLKILIFRFKVFKNASDFPGGPVFKTLHF